MPLLPGELIFKGQIMLISHGRTGILKAKASYNESEVIREIGPVESGSKFVYTREQL